jgi:hypothetical protein
MQELSQLQILRGGFVLANCPQHSSIRVSLVPYKILQ